MATPPPPGVQEWGGDGDSVGRGLGLRGGHHLPLLRLPPREGHLQGPRPGSLRRQDEQVSAGVPDQGRQGEAPQQNFPNSCSEKHFFFLPMLLSYAEKY